MKAAVFTEYGSPDVLRLEEVERPTPKDKEVRVKIHAASANPLDWHKLRGQPFLVRLEGGLLKPKYTILGADIAGRVEAVGDEVTQFRRGDEVFGDIDEGGFAEYVCVTEDKLVPKPTRLSFKPPPFRSPRSRPYKGCAITDRFVQNRRCSSTVPLVAWEPLRCSWLKRLGLTSRGYAARGIWRWCTHSAQTMSSITRKKTLPKTPSVTT